MSNSAKDLNAHDDLMIGLIVRRFNNSYPGFLPGGRIERALITAHCGECTLDLAGLLVASDTNFTHDVHGLSAHANKDTGLNTDEFMPRCTTDKARAAIEEAAAAARVLAQEASPQGYGESVEITPDDIGDTSGVIGEPDCKPLPK